MPGLPNEDGKYVETPQSLAAQLERFIDHGWLNIVGGCCGTTDAHIRAIAQMAEGKSPRALKPPSHRAFYSGIELVEAEDSNRPLIVGERTNVIGSRLFKNLVAEEKWEEATEIARRQVKNGAHIVDVCLQSTDRDEIKDIPPFYEKLIRKIKAPMMIDTTDPRAVELALTYCQGKSIINSINLEDGEEKFERICPVAKAYGAALVVGCIDEDKLQAQAFTRERKLAVAERSVRLLTEKYGIPPEDIIIDPAGISLRHRRRQLHRRRGRNHRGHPPHQGPDPPRQNRAGDFEYLLRPAGGGARSGQLGFPVLLHQGGARSGHRQRREARALRFHPRRRAPPGREPALQHPAGGRRRRCCCIAPEDWRSQTPRAKGRRSISSTSPRSPNTSGRPSRSRKFRREDLPLDQRLANYIIEGTEDGLIADLDRKRAEGAAPLDIINGPLMAGMAEVGRLFNNNELIVAEVLQSAEAMKAAVNHLEQFMEKADTAARGKILLATVKGDVHDIGKNLVEIILSNNGYHVINLGIKVPPGDPDPRLPGAQAGCHRPLRPAGEERAADGDHGGRPARRRHPACRCWSAARRFPTSSPRRDRAGLRRGRLLRQRRHDRPAPDEPAHGSRSAREAVAGSAHLDRGAPASAAWSPEGVRAGR